MKLSKKGHYGEELCPPLSSEYDLSAAAIFSSDSLMSASSSLLFSSALAISALSCRIYNQPIVQ